MCAFVRVWRAGEELVSLYTWCLHCERAYLTASWKVAGRCPGHRCDGSLLFDGVPWDEVRAFRGDYPELPITGKLYPLYD